jgi:hypothetical protein
MFKLLASIGSENLLKSLSRSRHLLPDCKIFSTLEEAPEAARLPELQLAPLSGPDPQRGQRQTINE